MVIQSAIINEDTLSIMAHIGGPEYEATESLPFPGVDFGMDTDEGKALLGTPNGVGIAWLMINHKDFFAGKTVQSVKMYSDSGPSLLFKIG